jgi:hypothetical protein
LSKNQLLMKYLGADLPAGLVHSFRALWSDDVRSGGTSRVTWGIEPVGDLSCALDAFVPAATAAGLPLDVLLI